MQILDNERVDKTHGRHTLENYHERARSGRGHGQVAGKSVMCQHVHVSESSFNQRPSCRIPRTRLRHRHRGMYPRTASHAVSSERAHWARRGFTR